MFTNPPEAWRNIQPGVQFKAEYTGANISSPIYCRVWLVLMKKHIRSSDPVDWTPPGPLYLTIPREFFKPVELDPSDPPHVQLSLTQDPDANEHDIDCWSPLITIKVTADKASPSRSPGPIGAGWSQLSKGEQAGICIGAIVGGFLLFGMLGEFFTRCYKARQQRLMHNEQGLEEERHDVQPSTRDTDGDGHVVVAAVETMPELEGGKTTTSPVHEMPNTEATLDAQELEGNTAQPSELYSNPATILTPTELDAFPADRSYEHAAGIHTADSHPGPTVVSPLSSVSFHSTDTSRYLHRALSFTSPTDTGYDYAYGYTGTGPGTEQWLPNHGQQQEHGGTGSSHGPAP
ncbi:hypothetical protein V8F20_010915 [Naviculisporaceae sp. PSN 640]